MKAREFGPEVLLRQTGRTWRGVARRFAQGLADRARRKGKDWSKRGLAALCNLAEVAGLYLMAVLIARELNREVGSDYEWTCEEATAQPGEDGGERTAEEKPPAGAAQ